MEISPCSLIRSGRGLLLIPLSLAAKKELGCETDRKRWGKYNRSLSSSDTLFQMLWTEEKKCVHEKERKAHSKAMSMCRWVVVGNRPELSGPEMASLFHRSRVTEVDGHSHLDQTVHNWRGESQYHVGDSIPFSILYFRLNHIKRKQSSNKQNMFLCQHNTNYTRSLPSNYYIATYELISMWVLSAQDKKSLLPIYKITQMVP